MKFLARLGVLMALVALVATSACSDKEKFEEIERDREQLTQTASEATAQLLQTIDRLKSDNQALASTLTAQRRQLDDMEYQVRRLADQAGVAQARAQDRAARSGGFGLFQFILLIIIIAAIVFALYRIFRPRPLDDEDDDDFASFDDDYGLEDEEDFGDDDRGSEDSDKK